LRPSSVRGNHEFELVSELIDPLSKSWDLEKVNQIFCQQDVESILKIPIAENAEDLIAWHYDNRGVFSVKSAYKVLDLAKHLARQAGSSGGGGG
jgi:hypothetical protein